jgi:hypothetical protein
LPHRIYVGYTFILKAGIALYAPVQGNARAKKWEWVDRGVGGDFWDNIGNVIEENM